MRSIVLLMAGAGLLAGAGTPVGDEARETLDALRGRWTMVSLEVNGEAVPEEQVKTGSLVVEQDRYGPTLGGSRREFSMVLDPASNPKAIDLTFTNGPQPGKTLKGIYALFGDRFTVCRGLTPENVRPTEFATGAESGSSLVVWKREKSEEQGKDTSIKEEGARSQAARPMVSAGSSEEAAMAVTFVEYQDNRSPGPQLLGEILPAVLARLGLSAVDLNLSGELTFGRSNLVGTNATAADATIQRRRD